MIHPKLKTKHRTIIVDDSKYGAPHDDDWTHNKILGYVKVAKVKEAERLGAITYVENDFETSVGKNGYWAITTEEFTEGGRLKRRISRAWRQWMEKEEKGKDNPFN